MAARWLSALFITVCVTTILRAQNTYWQQFVHYDMDVTLIPLEHALAGEETIWYKNNSPDTLTQFYLHLYPNAYRNSKTVRAREAKRFHRKLLARARDAGFIDIESFKIITPDEAGSARTVTAFKVDDTILEADLPQPLPPGDSLRVELSFYLKVRKFSGRAGYRGYQYDFAQWYPKVCVYDETGWNAEPFHLNGEFYGEFGTFNVTIRVPPTYIVAATGTVVSGDPGWNTVQVDTTLSEAQWQQAWENMADRRRRQGADGQMRSVTFHAGNVHDFAWSTCPDFLYERGEWDGIPIHVLYRSRVKKQWSKVVVRRGAHALAWLSGKFGRYPYPQLTIVHGLLGGGMEYPMLVMNSSESESLIFHEVGHIYFYGILGNNEWKEAWLDEGFTSFQTRWYLETRYGRWGFDRQAWLRRATWLQRHRPGNTGREAGRNMALSYILSGYDEPISKPAYSYNEPFSYSMNAYTKGAFFYDMLRYVVGEKTFEKICREYFDRWKFKHVNEMRFKQVCEAVSGMDLDWFFDEWLHKTVKVDYALGDVKKANKDSLWLTEVQVLRKEKGKMPVEVQLVTEAGDTVTQRWPGLASEGWLTFETRSKPKRVVLDPGDKVLDVRRFNNGPPRVEVLFDYPNLSYAPRQTYLVTWRPSGWVNDVDKVRLGGRVRSHYGRRRNAELGLWYGTDSHQLDVRFRYANPITTLGPRTRGTFLVQKMEGRFEVDAHLTLVTGKHWLTPPHHRLWIGFNHSKLLSGTGQRYVVREFDQKNDIARPTWQKGDVNKLYFRYALDSRGLNWFSNLLLGVDTVQEDWGSDFTYNTLFSELKFWAPRREEGFSLRFYAKRIYHSQDAPIQDQIFLDGANPRARFRRFYLRSDGGLPEELHYHLPGGGNLRGYFNQPITGSQIFALNLELRKSVRKFPLARSVRRILGTTGVVAFVDLASLDRFNGGNDFFADAGLGFRFRTWLPDKWYTIFTGGRNLTLRLDFPIWVNEPLPDERAVRFQWVFGFEQAI